MDKEKVTELLKNYLSYKYAVQNFEAPRTIGIATAVYDDMPRGGGYGSRPPSHNDGISLQDIIEYQEYKRTVQAIETALHALTDTEREVIELKYMKGWTLRMIEMYRPFGTNSTKAIHKRALNKLSICWRFVETPTIVVLHEAKILQNA